MSLHKAVKIFEILREVDLGRIKLDSEEVFEVLLLGDEVHTSSLARNLGSLNTLSAVHPWVKQQGLEDDISAATVAVLIASDFVLNDAENATLGRLYQQGIPALIVLTGETFLHERRSHETSGFEKARVIIPDLNNYDDLKRNFAPALFETTPESLRLSLSRQLPLLRGSYVSNAVEATARANAIYTMSTGLGKVIPVLNIPLNVADSIILIKNQLVMAYKLALAAGKEGKPQDVMGEILSVLGGGFLMRQLSKQLVGLVPVIGIVPKVAVAYGGTHAIGHAVTYWASSGRRLELGEVQRSFEKSAETGKQLAHRLMGKTVDTDTEDVEYEKISNKKKEG